MFNLPAPTDEIITRIAAYEEECRATVPIHMPLDTARAWYNTDHDLHAITLEFRNPSHVSIQAPAIFMHVPADEDLPIRHYTTTTRLLRDMQPARGSCIVLWLCRFTTVHQWVQLSVTPYSFDLRRVPMTGIIRNIATR